MEGRVEQRTRTEYMQRERMSTGAVLIKTRGFDGMVLVGTKELVVETVGDSGVRRRKNLYPFCVLI